MTTKDEKLPSMQRVEMIIQCYMDSNQYAQIKGLAGISKLCREQITKVLNGLCRCEGWSRPLLFTCNKVRFSYGELHINESNELFECVKYKHTF